MEQTPNLLPYFITGIVMMVLGWAMGFYDSNINSSKKIKEAEDASHAAAVEAKNRIAQAEAKLASIAAGTSHADNPGLLRIKSENGLLTLDLDGQPIQAAAMTAEQRKRLTELLTLMRPWLEGKTVTIPAPAQPLPAENALRDVFDASALSAPAVPSASPNAAAPIAPAKEDRPAAPAGSIVDQIDTILQMRLSGTPLASRGIYLAQSLEGGVVVYVGTATYMGVEEVPDPEVKAAIRAAIQEWENKYTPGL